MSELVGQTSEKEEKKVIIKMIGTLGPPKDKRSRVHPKTWGFWVRQKTWGLGGEKKVGPSKEMDKIWLGPSKDMSARISNKVSYWNHFHMFK